MTIFELLKSPEFPQKTILEKLLIYQLGLSKEQLFSRMDDQIEAQDLAWIQGAYKTYVVDKKPLEYIIQQVTFAGLSFKVTPDTIIPRPETEYMIEAIREFFTGLASPLRGGGEAGGVTVIDIGTGSGILGLTTIYYCGEKIQKAYLIDLSAEALEVAKQNAAVVLHTLPTQQTKISFLECSLLDHPELQDTLKSNEIVLIANLPYIPDDMFATNADLSITTREPKMAFVGGEDGLDLYREMFDQILTIPPLIKGGEGGFVLTMFLEMMTRQGKLLADEYQEHRMFEEVKTFHANIVILKVTSR